MISYSFPRWQELPEIDLYMDQVVGYLSQKLAVFYDTDDDGCSITATMINNYVKQKVIAPPVKKRYDREQLARLYCICLLKHVFTLSEIRSLMAIQTRTYPFPVAYDYFCVELEKALEGRFSPLNYVTKQLVENAKLALEDRKLVTSAEMAKTYTKGLNFVRHYVLEDGTFAGDNYGHFKLSPIAGPAIDNI